MGPAALRWYQDEPGARGLLAAAQHFMISPEMDTTIYEMQRSIHKVGKPIPFEWSLPAPLVCIEWEGELTCCLMCTHNDHVYMALPVAGFDGSVGVSTQRGSPEMWPLTSGYFRSNDDAAQALFDHHSDLLRRVAHHCDLTLSVIAEPRLVQRSRPCRPLRRAAARQLNGVVPTAWCAVTWTVGEECVPKSTASAEGHRRPLHFKRAHWAKAQEGQPKARRRPGYPGWWRWVKHAWPGHPDYGVILHHYTPKIDPGGKSAATLAAKEAAIAAWQSETEARKGSAPQ